VQHFIPTIGLRIEFLRSNRELAYSCDSESCSLVLRRAEGADVLIHEVSDLLLGHSSAAQAGKAPAQEEVGAL